MSSQVRTILLLGVLSALLIGVGGLIGQGAMAMAVALAVVMNVGAYFFSDRIVLGMHRAEELGPDRAPGLQRMVEELSASAGIPKPRLYLIPEAQPNAFATGRNPERGVVAVTNGLLRLLSEREVRGVIAHEIAHIKNRDILVATVASAIAAAVGTLANILTFLAFFGGRSEGEEGGSALGSLLAILVAPIAATLIRLGVSRSREYLADETGARIARDPEGLASALERLERTAPLVPVEHAPATASLFIVNPLAGAGGLSRWFSTHPPMRERVRRLRGMTGSRSYPRVA
jgi:heat shock protein HtpX